MKVQEVRAEIQRPQAPLLLSVEMIPDPAAGSVHAIPQRGDGGVAPIAVDPEATNPRGVAQHAIEWRLGVRPGAPPFLACVGDRYCLPDEFATERVRGLG